MSFLDADDETLAAALAFVDGFDAPRDKKKRVRSASSSSTALQRRQKAETLKLREQVGELQEQLQMLEKLHQQNRKSLDSSEGENDEDRARRKMIFDHAMVEYKARLEAEKVNYKLREMLAKQKKFGDALKEMMQKQSLLEDLSFVQDLTPRIQRPLTDAYLTRSQLEKKVENLYLCSGELFHDQHSASISSHTVIAHDEKRGKVIQMMTVTPDQGVHPDSLQKDYFTTASIRTGVVSMKKWNYARKFIEPSRAVIGWANRMLLLKNNLQMHLQSSTVITYSEADPVNSSVVRSFLQLYSEPLGGGVQHGETYNGVHESILAFAGDIFRQHLQSQQNNIISKAGRNGEDLADHGVDRAS
ncbi:unnamed protein product [Phytophthora lilii]|uniref:Unnamed protein product n=1 Tax=Phytophthora lilii TaxID=2077276 RepID=A0A9W6WQ02_9STRA|nr:unnamed protein product [Phytophthora lilii]